MEFVKKLREEFASLHAETQKFIEASATTEPTAEAKAENDNRFSRMEAIKAKIDDEKRFAKLALDEGKAILPVEPAGKKDYEISVGETFDSSKKIDRQEFGRAASNWLRTGQMAAKYATITSATQSGILLPVGVEQPVIPVGNNAFRDAHTVYGLPVFTTPSTAKINVPVMSATAGGLVTETASSETENEPGFTGSIALACSTYQSGTCYFSNLELEAVDYDLLGQTAPALVASKELGLESAIVAAIKADGNVTQSVTTASTTTVTDAIKALEKQLKESNDALENNPELAGDGMHEALRQDALDNQHNINMQLQQLYANREALTQKYWENATAINAEGEGKIHDAQNKAREEALKKEKEFHAQMLEESKRQKEALEQSANALAQSLASPSEKYVAEIMKLDNLFAQGAIGMDLWKRGAKEAMKELDGSVQHFDYHAPDVQAVRGSQVVEAPPAIVSSQKKVEETALAQLEVARQQARDMTRLADAWTTGRLMVRF